MKKDIHPKLKEMTVKCSTCSAEHTFRTTADNVSIDVCSSCHAFYTGNTSAVKSAGRVERFNNMLKKVKK